MICQITKRIVANAVIDEGDRVDSDVVKPATVREEPRIGNDYASSKSTPFIPERAPKAKAANIFLSSGSTAT